MNKTQKIIILIALALIFLSVIYAPYQHFSLDSNGQEKELSSGWDWIFTLGFYRIQMGMLGDSMQYWNHYYKIRLDLLVCEIFAIGVLACFFIVLTKRVN